MSKIVNTNLFFLSMFILCYYNYGCNGIKNDKTKEYELFYSIENQNNKIIGYQIRVIRDSFKIRKEKIYYIDTLGEIHEKSSSKFYLDGLKIYKYFDSDDKFQSKKPYLIFKKDTCVEFNANDESTPVVNCFLKSYSEDDLKMYVFRKNELAFDGTRSISYYNDKFILVREEYPGGVKSQFVLKIIKNNSKLLKVLKDEIQ